VDTLNPVYFLLIFVPIAILGEFLHWSDVVVFAASALAIVPLANLLGDATEVLAAYAGPKLGGLINATLGNAAELIITIFAIRAGLLELVKASITGSILGNILLILGLSLLLGGLRNGIQSFDQRQAGVDATMMTLSVIALAIPTLFGRMANTPRNAGPVEWLSVSVAALMLILYVLWLIFSLASHPGTSPPNHKGTMAHAGTRWSTRLAIALLVVATLLIAWLSEILVGVVEPAATALGLTEFFIGIIIVPLVGNAAEHLVAIQAAIKNQMDLSLAVSLGSSMQIALFVAPLLVFFSIVVDHPMDLVFNTFELASLGAAVLIATFVAQDGESNWLEGAQLLGVYAIIALAFFFLPI